MGLEGWWCWSLGDIREAPSYVCLESCTQLLVSRCSVAVKDFTYLSGGSCLFPLWSEALGSAQMKTMESFVKSAGSVAVMGAGGLRYCVSQLQGTPQSRPLGTLCVADPDNPTLPCS